MRLRVRFDKRKALVVVVVAAIVAAVYGINMAYTRSNPQRWGMYNLRRGNYTQALEALAKVEKPSASLLALQLAVRLGSLSANYQLLQEYEMNWTRVSSFTGAQEALQKRRDQITLALANDSQRLQKEAAQFQKVYKRGTDLGRFRGFTLRYHTNDYKLNDAMLALKGGEYADKYMRTFETGVRDIAVLSTVQTLYGQAESLRVQLNQPLDVATFLFTVGAKVNDHQLARWYMNEVVELTKGDSQNPVGSLAQQFLQNG